MDSDKRELITFMSKEIRQNVIIRIDILSEISADMPGAESCIVFLDNNYQNHCVYANAKKGCIKRVIWDDEKNGEFNHFMSDVPMEVVNGNVLILKITLL